MAIKRTSDENNESYIQLTHDNYNEVATSFGFKGFGYQDSVIGSLVMIGDTHEDSELIVKYKDNVMTRREALDKFGFETTKFVFFYGFNKDEMRLVVLDWCDFKHEMFS